MRYLIDNQPEIPAIHPGDIIEILESYYHKYASEISVCRVRIKGRIYETTSGDQSIIDVIPMRAHEGYVEGISRTNRHLRLKISPLASDDEYDERLFETDKMCQ